jgi:hypothetical protein
MLGELESTLLHHDCKSQDETISLNGAKSSSTDTADEMSSNRQYP